MTTEILKALNQIIEKENPPSSVVFFARAAIQYVCTESTRLNRKKYQEMLGQALARKD